MRTTRLTSVTLAATLLAAAPALADETSPSGDAPVKTAQAEPGTAPTATPTPTPPPADATPPAEDEEESATTGWFRLDTDSLDTQLWLGATHSVGSFSIASDIYVVGATAELDVGPSFSFGKLSLTPMAGITFDFASENLATLVAPQLFTIYDGDKLYYESWIQWFVNSIFTDGAEDDFYTRHFLLYKLYDELAIGPQVELTYKTNTTTDDMGMSVDPDVVALPIGGRVNVGYGKNNTLGLFIGYDTKKGAGSDGIAGRFTFVHNW